MHTVELLDEALVIAQRLGFRLRQEWLGGSGGGDCEFNGQKWFFLDLALSPEDQLEQIIAALRSEGGIASMAVSPPLARLLYDSRWGQPRLRVQPPDAEGAKPVAGRAHTAGESMAADARDQPRAA
jgi:hypothetical protein